jgi:hypothetical protein
MPKAPKAKRPARNIAGLTSLYRRWMQFLRTPEETFESFHQDAMRDLRTHGYEGAVFDAELFPSLNDDLPLAGNLRAADLPVAWDSTADVQDAATTPLEKLLVAFLWKQGDLWKFERLLDGIRDVPVALGDSDRAVMDQFGRHLRDPLNEPIFDQHTARHMDAMNHLVDPGSTLETFQGTAEHLLGREQARRNYKTWWSRVVMPAIANRNRDEDQAKAMLFADRTMFSLGKALSPSQRR